MKKALLVLAAVSVLALSLAGCGNNGASSSATSSSSSSSSASASSSVQADDQTVDFQLTGYNCQVTIPGALADICETEVSTDGTGITFFSTNNKDNFGGNALAIWMVSDEDAKDPYLFEGCDGTPRLLSQDADNHMSFYLVHPYTDVQFDPSDKTLTAEYVAIVDAENVIGDSFTWTRAEGTANPPAGSSGGSAAAAAWTSAYQGVLDQAISGSSSDYSSLLGYSVYDMDNDGVPELFVKSGTCEADFMYTAYTYQDSKAVTLGDFGGGHSQLCGLNGDGLLVQYAHQGEEQLIRYQVQNGALDQGETLSKTSNEDYHDVTPLPTYALDDASGLAWTANPTEDNTAILESLS